MIVVPRAKFMAATAEPECDRFVPITRREPTSTEQPNARNLLQTRVVGYAV